jgi:glycine dehydrogenase subunit 2
MRNAEPVIYELSAPGRGAARLPDLDVPASRLPAPHLLRQELPLPEVAEVDLMRHYVRLSQLNYGVDVGFYPLGSCTMKYNPKVNEDAVRLPGFTEVHPYQPVQYTQGAAHIMVSLQLFLSQLSGFNYVSMQPAAGAQGELSGVLMMRAYHRARGETQRTQMLIPDTAHGTNPASCAMVGFEMIEIKSDARGNVDLADLRAHLSDKVAGLMLTNPNTLGLFDENILEITRLVHEAGGLVYGDGANFNALMGIAKPADLGFDLMHFNLHKTFSTPHGGGGPGSGPVGATDALSPFLPGPVVVAEPCFLDPVTGDAVLDYDWEEFDEDEDDDGEDEEEAEPPVPGLRYRLAMPDQSIGRIKSFFGHFGVMVRAYTYIRMLGAQGLLETSLAAVLNANYLQSCLKDTYPLPYDRLCMHEVVLQGKIEGAPDIRALDISKRLIDYGMHPPTNYFPLIVPEALMIEPTETESKRNLDAFVQAMKEIALEARENPQRLRDAPLEAPVRRLDEVRAARNLILRWEE